MPVVFFYQYLNNMKQHVKFLPATEQALAAKRLLAMRREIAVVQRDLQPT